MRKTYINYLKDKNLSTNTISSYLKNINYFLNNFVDVSLITKNNLLKFLNSYKKNHKPNTVRLMRASILSYLKYLKKWKLYDEFKDIRMPKVTLNNKVTISIEEFNLINKEICLTKEINWKSQRNWLLFSLFFYTGIRASEVSKVKLNKIINNSIEIIGKGNKSRMIYLPSEFLVKWKDFKLNQLNFNHRSKEISYKQMNLIIKQIGNKYFNKDLTLHSLRRSYATNLLRSNIDIKTVAYLLGHSNINTTARYIFYTNEEIINKVNKIF